MILPQHITADEKGRFESLLNELTSPRPDLETYDEYLKFSSEVSSGLVKGNQIISGVSKHFEDYRIAPVMRHFILLTVHPWDISSEVHKEYLGYFIKFISI